MFQLTFTDTALRSLKVIQKQDVQRILRSLEELAVEPKLKSNVKRLRNHPIAIYRLRVGNYRILFDIEENLRVIEVVEISHRKSIYK